MNLGSSTSNMGASAATKLPAQESVVIMGLDDRGRPHASRFPGADVAPVKQAALLMGMVTLVVEGDVLSSLAGRLPVGKLFASGKAFVPFVGQDLFAKLVPYLPVAKRKAVTAARKRASGDDASTPASKSDGEGSATSNAYASAKEGGKPRSGKHPEDWDKIKVGHIVLASEERDDGWWTAHVREARADGTYLLEWEEWKGFDRFVCRREQIALLHPDYDGK